MKLIMENWKKYVNEAEDEALKKQAKKHAEILKNFLAVVLDTVQAYKDVLEEPVTEGRFERRKKRRDKKKSAITKKIEKKQKEWIDGISMDIPGLDWHDLLAEPGGKTALYDDAREEIYQQRKEKNDAEMLQSINTLLYGDVLENPIIKTIATTIGGEQLHQILKAAAQSQCRGENLSVDCLVNYAKDLAEMAAETGFQLGEGGEIND